MIKLTVYSIGGSNCHAVQSMASFERLNSHISSKVNHGLQRLEVLYIFNKRNFA